LEIIFWKAAERFSFLQGLSYSFPKLKEEPKKSDFLQTGVAHKAHNVNYNDR
tara:strand:+ start:584 stop:739 length:156 start_codon:yes stop_codon:yes gene_type:complete